jgi:metal-dependent amidase/aminoacylase/carboxypeptidase family protein
LYNLIKNKFDMKKGFLIGGLLVPLVLFAQKKPTVKELDKWKTQASSVIQERYYQYKDIAFKIWDYAELGYKEVKSSALLQETLKDNGFSVEAGVAGIPTAFVASYGSGSPVLGILAEFDALPGLSQQAVAEKNPIAGQANGHGCGHHLFGTASVAAAIAVKEQLQAQGWKAPNVVPDFAEVYYYVRHPNREIVMQLFERIQKAAEGAAIGTETRTDFEIIGGTYDLLLNNQLAEIMQVNLVKVGGVIYTSSEKEFANKIQGGLGFKADPIETAGTVNPIQINTGKTTGSTDVGDVSYAVPTVGLRAATWVPGTPAHSWQAVACGGTEIGIKGMMVAAKTMAMTLLDLLHQPEQLSKAKAEFDAARGPGFRYIPLLGDRSPALNYRN